MLCLRGALSLSGQLLPPSLHLGLGLCGRSLVAASLGLGCGQLGLECGQLRAGQLLGVPLDRQGRLEPVPLGTETTQFQLQTLWGRGTFVATPTTAGIIHLKNIKNRTKYVTTMSTIPVPYNNVYHSCSIQQCLPFLFHTTMSTIPVPYNNVYHSCSIQQCLPFLFHTTMSTIPVPYNNVYHSCSIQQCLPFLFHTTMSTIPVPYNNVYHSCSIQQCLPFLFHTTLSTIPVPYNNVYHSCSIQQ